MTSKISLENVMPRLLQEIKTVFERVRQEEIEVFADIAAKAARVFIYGAGRVGTASRAFAMRLAQLGKITYWVQDDTTPNPRGKIQGSRRRGPLVAWPNLHYGGRYRRTFLTNLFESRPCWQERITWVLPSSSASAPEFLRTSE